MSANEFANALLAIVGIILQLVFKYFPIVSTWYQAQDNKGVLMLVFVVIMGAGYVAIGCSPYAADLHITQLCNRPGIFTLLNAIFIIATSQQLTYLFTRGYIKAE